MGVRGVLVIVVDNVHNISKELANHHVFLAAHMGDYKEVYASKETWQLPAKPAEVEEVSPSAPEQLTFLLSKQRGAPGLSPKDAAWVLGLESDKVEAFANGSLEACFGQELRLQVKDPIE